MVVFTNGLSDKREYRKFRMRTNGNDDYLHMKEVLSRRFAAKNAKWPTPDLILIDGGKGQLSAALEIVKQKVPVVGIAKREEELIIDKTGSNVNLAWFDHASAHPEEGVNILDEKQYLTVNLHGQQTHSHGHAKNLLGEDNSDFSDLTKLFQRIRDESHRFAINYHSSLRNKSQTKNALEEIEGVGPKTRAKLLRRFGSLKKIQESDVSSLEGVVGPKLAKSIKVSFKA